MPNSPAEHVNITLGTEVFSTAFPFHVAFDPEGAVLQVGPSLAKLLPDLRPGSKIDAHLTVKRPDVPLKFDAVAKRCGSLFLLQAIDRAMLLLNGQMLPLDRDTVVFLGAPWVTDASQLELLGLTLQDFAIHDPVGDYVALLHAQSVALADANRLAEALEERVRTNEEHLRQSQKMEAIGRLAGGVAHDFNNILTVVLGHAEAMQALVADGTPARSRVDEILTAANRAADLTKQLLTFSRRHQTQPKVVRISDAVADSETLLTRLIGEHIRLVVRHDPDVSRITVDPGQLTQVIMNLSVNARDAMPKGGTLAITTENRELTEKEAHRIGVRAPGRYAVLRVRDTGCGMDTETLSHAFEPFFTTKEKGKGTGLGLATVYGIVHHSGGHVAVTSAPGDGTEFSIYFPAVDAQPADQQPAKAAAPVQEQGRETILLLEDEDQVRRFVGTALTQQGYRVIEASRESEAVTMAEQYNQAIDLLLTDVVLPEMSGKELLHKLTKKRPQLKVLYMSGYSDPSMLQQAMISSDAPLLNKPFTPSALGRKVRDILDHAPRALSA